MHPVRALVRNGLWLALIAAWPAALPAMQPPARADFSGETASEQARTMADWVVAGGDSQGLPFLIIDKAEARVFAFDARGVLVRSAPALLGLARGDVSPPGIGSKRLSEITPAERITPAGRFAASLGRNLAGQTILWIDYDSALSLHRVVTTNRAEQRLQRLASPGAGDNRVSYGCINVPADFYDEVVEPLFGPADGIVYILPEGAPSPSARG